MTAVMDTAWHASALAMRDDGKNANEVADEIGKHPATIRKLFARNPPASSNGHGDPGLIPGQTTVDDHLPPEDDPEHPDTLAEFRGEAGAMPPSRAVDPQDGFFDVAWDDARLLEVLEAREETRAAKLSASKAHKINDDEAKALLEGYSLAVGEVARIGRFRIKKTRREGSDVSFTTEPREQLQIAVDSGE